MTKMKLLAAAVCGCVTATSAFGGFVVTHTQSSVNTTLERIDFYALNTGGETGTGLLIVEMSTQTLEGVALFRSTAAGNWNPLNPLDIAERSWVRIDPDDANSSTLVYKTPNTNQPLAPDYGSSTVALENFSVGIANLNATVPPQSTAGNHFARLFVSKLYRGPINGYVGGSAGAKVGFSTYVGPHVDDFDPPVIAFSPSNEIVVDVSSGIPQSMPTVSATVSDHSPLSYFLYTDLPAVLVDNVSIIREGADRFSITGSDITAADVGTHAIMFRAEAIDAGGPTAATFTLRVVVPEPTMLSVLGIGAFVRRKR